MLLAAIMEFMLGIVLYQSYTVWRLKTLLRTLSTGKHLSKMLRNTLPSLVVMKASKRG